MTKISEKIHKINQEKALDKALKKIVPNVTNYFIEENNLYVRMDVGILNERNAANLRLPSIREIENEATKIYKNFESGNISKTIYLFNDIAFNEFINIYAPNSELRFCDCYLCLNNIFIRGAKICNFIGCHFVSNMNMEVTADKIYLERIYKVSTIEDKKINTFFKFNAKELEINDANLRMENNILIDSNLITLIDTIIIANKLNIQCDLIETNATELRANEKINISSTCNDAVKSVFAPKIVYNGKDITYSDSIVRPKLIENLIKELKEIRNIVTETIHNDAVETARIRKKNLEEQPVTKILNKKNI